MNISFGNEFIFCHQIANADYYEELYKNIEGRRKAKIEVVLSSDKRVGSIF
jgi:hypothetical protein